MPMHRRLVRDVLCGFGGGLVVLTALTLPYGRPSSATLDGWISRIWHASPSDDARARCCRRRTSDAAPSSDVFFNSSPSGAFCPGRSARACHDDSAPIATATDRISQKARRAVSAATTSTECSRHDLQSAASVARTQADEARERSSATVALTPIRASRCIFVIFSACLSHQHSWKCSCCVWLCTFVWTSSIEGYRAYFLRQPGKPSLSKKNSQSQLSAPAPHPVQQQQSLAPPHPAQQQQALPAIPSQQQPPTQSTQLTTGAPNHNSTSEQDSNLVIPRVDQPVSRNAGYKITDVPIDVPQQEAGSVESAIPVQVEFVSVESSIAAICASLDGELDADLCRAHVSALFSNSDANIAPLVNRLVESINRRPQIVEQVLSIFIDYKPIELSGARKKLFFHAGTLFEAEPTAHFLVIAGLHKVFHKTQLLLPLGKYLDTIFKDPQNIRFDETHASNFMRGLALVGPALHDSQDTSALFAGFLKSAQDLLVSAAGSRLHRKLALYILELDAAGFRIQH
eukprot:m.816361 g.816361  ORF g.816361 m.816361 type:complete len:514 (+) comp59385_c0_seq12:3-1544(+)